MKKIIALIFLMTFALGAFSQTEKSKYETSKGIIDSLMTAYNITVIEVIVGTTIVGITNDFHFTKGFLVLNSTITAFKSLYYINFDRLLDFHVSKDGKGYIMYFYFN